MLDRLRRTLERRRRMLHVRELQEEQAQQALAVLLHEEDALKRERSRWETAHAESHGSLLRELEADVQPLPSETVFYHARQMSDLSGFARAKATEIEVLQPAIQERREEVLRRYKARRAMEILSDHAQERVLSEELRLEQAALDETTAQRYGRRNGARGPE